MRVWFFSSTFPEPYDQTRGIYCLQLCKALARKHSVQAIAPRSWLETWRYRRMLSAEQEADNWEGIPVKRPVFYYPPKMLHWSYDWWMERSVRSTVRPLLAEAPPDCLVSYWAHPDGAVATQIGKAAGVPTGIIVGGSDVLLLTKQSRRRRAVQKALQAADAVIAVSEHLKVQVVELGIDPARVHAVRQGLDDELFYPADRQEARAKLGLPSHESILLWVGRMAPVKGLEVLLNACARLNEWKQSFHLCLVGDGPLRMELNAQADRLNLAQRISFVGTKLPSELPDWYRAADFTVLSSWSEGLPNVLRESVACGTPFIASKVGGIPEIADANRDRLVTPGDPDALATAIRAAIVGRAETSIPRQAFPGWGEHADAILSLLFPKNQ